MGTLLYNLKEELLTNNINLSVQLLVAVYMFLDLI